MSFRETSSSGSLSSSSSVPSTLEEANERKPNNYWTSLVAGGRGRLKSTNTTPKARTTTPKAAAAYKGSTPLRMTTPAVPHEDLFPEGMTPEEPTLYRVTSRNKSTSLTNVPTAKTSLNEGYSFILYVDKAHVWCWHGKKASGMQKARSIQRAKDMCTLGTVEALDQGNGDQYDYEFWEYLDDDGEIGAAGDDKEDTIVESNGVSSSWVPPYSSYTPQKSPRADSFTKTNNIGSVTPQAVIVEEELLSVQAARTKFGTPGSIPAWMRQQLGTNATIKETGDSELQAKALFFGSSSPVSPANEEFDEVEIDEESYYEEESYHSTSYDGGTADDVEGGRWQASHKPSILDNKTWKHSDMEEPSSNSATKKVIATSLPKRSRIGERDWSELHSVVESTYRKLSGDVSIEDDEHSWMPPNASTVKRIDFTGQVIGSDVKKAKRIDPDVERAMPKRKRIDYSNRKLQTKRTKYRWARLCAEYLALCSFVLGVPIVILCLFLFVF